MLIKLKYKELQILKHSLQYYITRSDATLQDIKTEKRMLLKVTNKVEEIKKKYKL